MRRAPGYAHPALFLDTPEAQFRGEMDVNYYGSLWPAQVASAP
jgi:hypothetical protein